MRKLAALAAAILLLCFFAPTASAEDMEKAAEEQLKRSGIEALIPLIPEDSSGVDGEALLTEGVSGWTPSGVLKKIREAVKQQIKVPGKTFLTVCGILLLAALLEAFREGMEEQGTAAAFGAAVSLSVSAAILSGVTGTLQRSKEAIEGLSRFVLGFIPVFSGIAAAAGRPSSAAVYQSVTFGAAQIFSKIAADAVLPLMGIFLAVCTMGSVSDSADVEGVAQSIKRTANWLLALCLTVFVGLLSVQTMASGAADTVANRTVRFVISSAVPVVGNALSEAYSSLFGCLGVVKSTAGVFGIVVMAGSLLPPVLELSLMMLSLDLAAGVGELLGEKRPVGMLRAISSAMGVMLGLILCYGMMILVSVAVLLLLGTPG